MRDLAPIVLFVYNRLHHTKETIEALQKNELAQDSRLFIYSDAPKDSETQKRVDEVRQYLETIDGFKSVTIIRQETNMGLAKSIIDGVTEVVNRYGKIIVLEDDIVTSPYFLRFMNDALELYEEIDRVMHISSYIYPIKNSGIKDTFFIKPASCWGWATWSRAWRYYKKDADFYIDKFDKDAIRDFNLNNSYNYFNQITLNKNREIDTWAIFWYATIYLQDGLSLHPKESFTHNIGHDGEGTHCKVTSNFDVDLIDHYPIAFEREIREDISARERIEEYFNGLKAPLQKRVLAKIKNLIDRVSNKTKGNSR
ncbi:sugar transferase [hydrothermal vent metagenome]|uniref:Sugar transferase n=1 Tax=hydrothermal vent metagenome TaxID=652676 RepID=A0A1W1BSQ3_9ZZZZ